MITNLTYTWYMKKRNVKTTKEYRTKNEYIGTNKINESLSTQHIYTYNSFSMLGQN